MIFLFFLDFFFFHLSFQVIEGWGLSTLMKICQSVLKIIACEETAMSSEYTLGALSYMCLISLHLPPQSESCLGCGVCFAGLTYAQNDKFLMESWRCSTNQNTLCLAIFSYCQHNSLEKGSVRETMSQVFNSPSGLDIFHQFLPFCFEGSPVLLRYPSPRSLWLALALTCLVSRLMSAPLFCFSLSSLISQYILATSVAFQDT